MTQATAARACTTALLAVTTSMLVGTCADGSGEGRTALTVFAAASLTDAFGEVGEAYEADHPDVDLELSFGPSSGLAAQLLDGAPADVFASADPTDVDEVVAAGEADGARSFARNSLQLAVPAGNPAGVAELADLADPDLLVGLCAEQVPCGRYSAQLLDLAGIAAEPDTREPDVRSLLTKLEAGELDVGLVYRTDVLAADGAVEGIDVPGADRAAATYAIATTTTGDEADVAEDFVDFVVDGGGQQLLRGDGFLAP